LASGPLPWALLILPHRILRYLAVSSSDFHRARDSSVSAAGFYFCRTGCRLPAGLESARISFDSRRGSSGFRSAANFAEAISFLTGEAPVSTKGLRSAPRFRVSCLFFSLLCVRILVRFGHGSAQCSFSTIAMSCFISLWLGSLPLIVVRDLHEVFLGEVWYYS
jgi:hypothetical protein